MKTKYIICIVMLICRYFSNGAECLQKKVKLFQDAHEELINAMDIVGFSEEVKKGNHYLHLLNIFIFFSQILLSVL